MNRYALLPKHVSRSNNLMTISTKIAVVLTTSIAILACSPLDQQSPSKRADSTINAVSTQLQWNDKNLWEEAVGNVINFFDAHAWDENSGSYASELDEKGGHVSELREPVPLGRMIYANAKAPTANRNLVRARASADFMLKYMMATDALGVWFHSAVNARGEVPTGASRPYLFIFEEAYPIAGLVALVDADPVANADLLPIIRAAAQGFWNRFHDGAHGGLFYYYNMVEKNHSNDRGETHKSYQSTIYPISSFLLALRDTDQENQALYDQWINELLGIAMDHLIERLNGEPTGWLTERFSESFAIDQSYLMSEAGHISQLSWVLSEAVKRDIVRDSGTRELYTNTAKMLLTKFLDHGGNTAGKNPSR